MPPEMAPESPVAVAPAPGAQSAEGEDPDGVSGDADPEATREGTGDARGAGDSTLSDLLRRATAQPARPTAIWCPRAQEARVADLLIAAVDAAADAAGREDHDEGAWASAALMWLMPTLLLRRPPGEQAAPVPCPVPTRALQQRAFLRNSGTGAEFGRCLLRVLEVAHREGFPAYGG